MNKLELDSINSIQSKEELVSFITFLTQDFLQHHDEWENVDISTYLTAIAAWVDDSNDAMLHNPEVLQAVAKILYLGKIYE